MQAYLNLCKDGLMQVRKSQDTSIGGYLRIYVCMDISAILNADEDTEF